MRPAAQPRIAHLRWGTPRLLTWWTATTTLLWGEWHEHHASSPDGRIAPIALSGNGMVEERPSQSSRKGLSTSSSLLRRVKSGTPEAWGRLLDLYSPLVYSWCRRAEIPAQDAADILQQVFGAVAAGIQDFRRDQPGQTFRGWLRAIARHKIVDHWRGNHGQPSAVGGTDWAQRLDQIAEPESHTSVALGSWSGLVRRALALIQPEFEDRTWRAFWGTTIDGRSAKEVADELAMTFGAVRQAKYKVLRRLREELGDVE